MRLTKYEAQPMTESVRVEDHLTCNCCGKTVEWKPKGDFMESKDGLWDGQMQNFNFSWGYASSHDTETWDFDLCEDCIIGLIKTFKVVPEGFKLYEMRLDPTRHQKVFDDWKETGEWEEYKYHTYEELVKYEGWLHPIYLNNLIEKYHPGRDLLPTE